ncbi:LiaI-LiaF-like domain-containing protein [Halanaerobium praevalens]|uniref:LiaI-LiaF-like transmembrane region domain-containing protein n=1 Tax=Halanaerobium praevalens (strain ATCC 33744 / DSM 2228 / GSL) TaxID=572479 RepID=E3DQA7_HALPG|nr:DUF5668 domain-containing protein [Halanaerobium praevalens]ADO77884.1 hypothetical protein Hprae_1759 [Halanaerobium praevalens DSM 2228]
MTANKDKILIAIILIFSGIIFLGDSLGQYQFKLFYFLNKYWPVLIIIFGFHILLQNTRLWFLVPLIIVFLALYLIYILVNQSPFQIYHQPRFPFLDFREGPFRFR